jgi:hypothetical protein
MHQQDSRSPANNRRCTQFSKEATLSFLFGNTLAKQPTAKEDVTYRGNITFPASASASILLALILTSYFLPNLLLSGRKNETGLEDEDIIKMTSVPGFFFAIFIAFQVFRFIQGFKTTMVTSQTPTEYKTKLALGFFRSLFPELISLLPLLIISVSANPLLLNILSDSSQDLIFALSTTIVVLLQACRAAYFFKRSPFSIANAHMDELDEDLPHSKTIPSLNALGILLPWLIVGPLIAYLRGIETTDDPDMGQAICLGICALIGAGITFVPLLSLGVNSAYERLKGSPATSPSKAAILNFLGQFNDRLLSGVLAAPALCACLAATNALNGWNMGWMEDPTSYQAFCMTITVLFSLAPYLTHGADSGCLRSRTPHNRTPANSNATNASDLPQTNLLQGDGYNESIDPTNLNFASI